ncbi:MAG: hypothetical protein IT289_09850 [Oligoflexia bacterium]|nr:hypothetical protein [Oligoflexia bacterium]
MKLTAIIALILASNYALAGESRLGAGSTFDGEVSQCPYKARALATGANLENGALTISNSQEYAMKQTRGSGRAKRANENIP